MHSKRMLTLNNCPFKWSTVIFQQTSAQNNLSSSHQELKFLLQGAISYFTTEEKVQNAKCLRLPGTTHGEYSYISIMVNEQLWQT